MAQNIPPPSQECATLVAYFEDSKVKAVYTAYPDTGDVWTVGLGSTRIKDAATGKMRPVREGDTMTREEAVAAKLDHLMRECWEPLKKTVAFTLSQGWVDCLCAFIHNHGWRGNVKALVVAGKLEAAAEDLPRYYHSLNKDTGEKVPRLGLYRRRMAEVALARGATAAEAIALAQKITKIPSKKE